jgi:hypothetical protein
MCHAWHMYRVLRTTNVVVGCVVDREHYSVFKERLRGLEDGDIKVLRSIRCTTYVYKVSAPSTQDPY